MSRTDMPFYIDLYRQGRLELDELLAEHIGLDDINDGYAQLKRRKPPVRSSCFKT